VNLELDGLLNNEVTREDLSQSVYDICQELKIAVVKMNCSLQVAIQDLQDFHVALTSLVHGLCDARENFMGASREECMSISDSDMKLLSGWPCSYIHPRGEYTLEEWWAYSCMDIVF
jgi:hypothetical protein